MNLTELEYVVEVERSGSISGAAKKLFVAQPNLSKAIKNLEEEFHILIFERTSKGVVTTSEGRVFLQRAKKVLQEVAVLKGEEQSAEKVRLKVSVPRASYITYAFTKCINEILPDKTGRINFEECSSTKAISNILSLKYGLGVIRYEEKYEEYFQDFLKLKGLSGEILDAFDYRLLVSAESPLAGMDEISGQDLEPCIEIVHGDIKIPGEEYLDLLSEELGHENVGKKIYVYERGSQFDLLTLVPNTYMWVSPMPVKILERYQVVEKRCTCAARNVKDVLIWKSGHKKSEEERLFVATLKSTIEEMRAKN
ncbi:LysR family transcriptional regulator [Hespellia stercorisuis]|uniref:DNA-binding transcriptional regulator, LysR family n=1 Tax=Hespellia stercorisuis DSM 15480 TaxID=1121950 RepID=A0A1M6HKY1_9FIRM|nr:LysR family transcriptional regulator [Hespellia stercorisuis]SHJ22874.1 DNA-binding transcriptional regulator, LysR family [Hespellia stercorisuis DSM 15480]